MVIRLQKNSEFGRNNANRSPNKQPKAMPRNGKFPGDYGEKSPRFGSQARYWNQLMAKKYGTL